MLLNRGRVARSHALGLLESKNWRKLMESEAEAGTRVTSWTCSVAGPRGLAGPGTRLQERDPDP